MLAEFRFPSFASGARGLFHSLRSLKQTNFGVTLSVFARGGAIFEMYIYETTNKMRDQR